MREDGGRHWVRGRGVRAGVACAGAGQLVRLEPYGEVAQLPGQGDDSHAGQVASPAGDPFDDFGHVVHVALGVGTAGDGEADQVQRGRGLGAVGVQAEHHRADLAAADPALEVQGAGEGLARVGQRVDVRQHRPGVDEHGVAAERHDDRDAAPLGPNCAGLLTLIRRQQPAD